MKPNADNSISVSPKKIRTQAEQAGYLCKSLLEHMKIIEGSVNSFCYFWNSDASNLLRKYFDEDRIDYAEIRNNLYAQIDKLNRIAKIYESSENAAQEYAVDLPNTIIE